MTPRANRHTDTNPLAPPSSRFPLSLPASAESPSAARPFILHFARPLCGPSAASWPSHRYCHERQVLVTDDHRDVPLADSGLGWESTTLFNKDGKDGPQEDWKPDLPFSAQR